MRNRWRDAGVAVCGLFLIVGVSGCQYSYPFDVSGVIRSAADGQPLAGARVQLRADGIREGREQFPVVTGADGKFAASIRVADIEFMRGDLPTWSLVISKEGFAEEVIDISLNRKPESPTTTVQIVVAAYMKSSQR